MLFTFNCQILLRGVNCCKITLDLPVYLIIILIVKMKKLYYKIIKTKIGRIAIIFTGINRESKVLEIILPEFSLKFLKKVYPDISPGRNKVIDKFVKVFIDLIRGEQTDLPLKYLDLSSLGKFQKKVLFLVRRIPKGKVETYGSIARKLGKPKSARAVGQALANNPFPLVIPCHRVIRTDGSLGGFGNNIRLKRKLLEMEGVCIK